MNHDILKIANATKKNVVQLMYDEGFAIVGFDRLAEAEEFANRHGLKPVLLENSEPTCSNLWDVASTAYPKEHDTMLDETSLWDCYGKDEVYELPSDEELETMSEEKEKKCREWCKYVNEAIQQMTDNQFLIVHDGWLEYRERFVTYWSDGRWKYQIGVM